MYCPALFAPLFGGEGQNTCLVVDAHLRQAITLVFNLDALDVPARDYFEAIAAIPPRCKDLFEMKSGHWISGVVSHASITQETQVITPVQPEILKAT